MKKNEIIDRSRKFAELYCVTNSKKFRLKDIDPDDTGEASPALMDGKTGVFELLFSAWRPLRYLPIVIPVSP